MIRIGNFLKAAVFGLALAASLPGHAAVLNISQNIGDVSGFTGQLNNNVNYSGVTYHINNTVGATSATVNFDLDLFRTMDGANCCTDVVTVSLSFGSGIFQAALAAPNGGGINTIYNNSLGVSITNTYWNSSTDLDAIYHISFVTNVVSGINDIAIAYSALQDFGDEAWGINNMSMTANNVPEPGSLALLGLGLAGLGFSRRRNAA